MQDAKEEIRSRLSVEDVVGQYVELKRAGRNLKGRSPWGVDKTPSFMVSPEKGIWHDFSANKGGDIFTFVMEVEGIGFRDALEKLAGQAGVDLSKYSGGDKKVAQKKARAREALALATRYYQACLMRNKSVCEYVFYKRNMNRGTVREFKIGYAPADGKALTKVLKRRGFSDEEYVIGFTARILGKGEPKYLNTPETLLFNKSRFIFGLCQAKDAIRRSGYVVIVEGNMDVISSHQAGVREAVATSGSAMTEQHLKALANLTSDIRLAYDGDDAGVRATERAIMMAGDLGIDLTVISDYHGAKDPDELIQKDPKLWQVAVTKNTPAMEWLLKKYEESVDLSSAVGKRKYSDVALKMLGYIKDEIERASYEEKVAKKLNVDVEILREKDDRLKKKLEQSNRKHMKKPITEVQDNIIKKLEDSLLALKVFGGITTVQIPIEIPEDDARLGELELIYAAEYENTASQDLEGEAKELLARYKDEIRKQKIDELNKKLAEIDEDSDEYGMVLREIRDLQKT